MNKRPYSLLAFLLLSCCTLSLASDPVTIDSLFKSQQGLRSVTTLQFLSSGSAENFNVYPELLSVNDGKVWQDTKSISLSQTLMYDITSKLDLMATVSGSHKSREYTDYSGYSSATSNNIDSLWVGGIYSFDMLGDLA